MRLILFLVAAGMACACFLVPADQWDRFGGGAASLDAAGEVAERGSNELAIGQGYTLLKFGADWCGPCRMIDGELNKLATTLPDLAIHRIDVDDRSSLAAQFGVRSIPALFLYEDGQQVGKRTGYARESELVAWIEQSSSMPSSQSNSSRSDFVVPRQTVHQNKFFRK